MKQIFTRSVLVLIFCWSMPAMAFTCQALGKTVQNSGIADVVVDLTPSIGVGQNMVVDLSQSIMCKNDIPQSYLDPVRIGQGSHYSGALKNFLGTVSYYGQFSSLDTPSSWVNHTWGDYRGWKTVLYLKPIGTASGIFIKANELIAQLYLEKKDSINNRVTKMTWNIYSGNDVVVPTGGCDVSARDVTVTLPDYPGSMAVPVTVHCAQNQNLGYYLSGTTADSANSIFTNTASASPAQGIGVQMTRNGTVVPANSNVSLGTVGTSPVNLGLTATYARTKGQVTAGNVQSIIEVTFVYQ